METISFQMHDGVRLVADAAGPVNGTPVILLHGGGQTRHAWGDALELFASEGYRSIAIDLRGHGESGWSPDGDYSLSTTAADIREVVAALGRPVVSIGASFGGMTSLLAFGENPQAPLLALVLVDITHQVDNVGTHRVRDFMTSGVQGFESIEEAAAVVAAYLPHRPRRRNPSGLSRNLRLRPDNRFYWHWDPRFITSFETTDYALIERRMTDALRRIEQPMLMVRGGASDVVSSDVADDFARLVPQAEVVAIPGAHHMVAGDDNSAFASAVIGFVRRVAEPT